MSQAAEREAAIRRIQKLVTQTQSAGRTEHEMNMAMDRAQQLMDAFNITLDEVSVRSQPCRELVIETKSTRRDGSALIIRGISEFCGVSGFTRSGEKTLRRDENGRPVVTMFTKKTRNGNSRLYHRFQYDVSPLKVVFFGMEQDIQMAQYLYEVIIGAIESELKAFKKTDAYKLGNVRGEGKRKSDSFVKAMASRVYRRLSEMADASRESNEEATGKDIVVIKDAYVESELKKTGVRLRRTVSRGATSGTGYRAGKQAGDRVNLSRPVGTGNASSVKLLA